MKKNNHIPLFHKIMKRYCERGRFVISIQFYLYFWNNCRSWKINRFHRDWRKWKGSSPFHATLGYNFRGAIGCFDQSHCFRANRQLPATLLPIDRSSTSMHVTI